MAVKFLWSAHIAAFKSNIKWRHFETKNYEARILVKIKTLILYQETAFCPHKRTTVLIYGNKSDYCHYGTQIICLEMTVSQTKTNRLRRSQVEFFWFGSIGCGIEVVQY